MNEPDKELSDAEKIRLKRLARLGERAVTTSPPDPSSPALSMSELKGESTRTPTSAASRLLSLPTSAHKAPAEASSSKASIPKYSSSETSLGKRPSLAEENKVIPRTVLTPRHTASPIVSYSEWEIRKVASILSVSLDREEARISDWRLCWLKGLKQELRSEDPDHNLRTTSDLIDRLVVARLSLDTKAMATSDDPDILTILAGLPQDETVFEYLTGCWKRLQGAKREMLRLDYAFAEKEAWKATANHLQGMIISYSGMTLEDPTMFPQPVDKAVGPAEFLPILLALTPNSPSGASDMLAGSAPMQAAPDTLALAPNDLLPFLKDLAAGFTDSSLADVITPTLSLLFQDWFKIVPTPTILGDEWHRYLGAVAILVQIKSLATLLPTLSIWVAPNTSAPKLEWQSLLGPLTRLSVYPRESAEVWKTYFSNPTERKKDDITANKTNLRHTLGGLHSLLFTIYNSIIRASPEARESVLDFFALVIRLNDKRAGMRVDPRTVSSDGYMTNLYMVLLKLFEPVIDASFSKIDKVDPHYFKISKRLDIQEETKIKATKEEADEYFKAIGMEVDSQIPNFISELFFLLNAFQHLGITKTIETRIKAERNISDLEKELRRAEATRPTWAGNPAMEAQGEGAIKKYQSDIATLHASIHAYDTQLLDTALIRPTVTCMGFLMTWLIRLVDPRHQYPTKLITLPLPTEVPIEFRVLPEYFFENVAEYYDFLARYEPDALEEPDKDILINFAIVFLSPGYVNNPFLKAKLVSVISTGLHPVGYWRQGTLYDRLTVLPLSIQYLMPTLIRFFIDVEITGGHTQFWDKFNFRRDISRIFRSLWSNPLHREAFVKARHDDFDQFIKFVNMLMSDTTFHLEESLTNLSKINSIESQESDEAAWSSLPDAERQDLASQLRQAESQAPFHTAMGLDHVELIRDLTANTREPFVTAEIVDRLAATLTENLVNLVGPKMQELRVSDPDKFSFKPKRLLAGLAQIYLNLSVESEFVRAVANDGRSYSKDVFERFARILKNRAIMTDIEVGQVVAFTQKVENMKATIAIEDQREIPDEFLDPLTFLLMKDPVILPVSRVSIDRGSIRTALFSKDVDPFNNVPLRLEDCLPDTELKGRIDAWIAEGQFKEAADVMDVDQM